MKTLKKQSKKKLITYYWMVQATKWTDFLFSHHASTLHTYSDRISGFVREDKLDNLYKELETQKCSDPFIIPSDQFWAEYDYYKAINELPKENL